MEKSIRLDEAILKTEIFVKEVHAFDTTGHDYAHIDRVRRMADQIGETETVDHLVLTLAALLHDVEDAKLGRPSGMVKSHLETIDISEARKRHVLTIIDEVSFSKGKAPTSLESAILQDADRLDAIGAIGIARTFQYAGSRGTPLHEPGNPSSALAHFEDKLLRLADGMHTVRAKSIAQSRQEYMQTFVTRFLTEWQHEDR